MANVNTVTELLRLFYSGPNNILVGNVLLTRRPEFCGALVTGLRGSTVYQFHYHGYQKITNFIGGFSFNSKIAKKKTQREADDVSVKKLQKRCFTVRVN